MFDQDAHTEDTSDHITYLLSNSETLTGASAPVFIWLRNRRWSGRPFDGI